MLKRILAWIILGGFVLLLLNIAIFHFYWQICTAVYVVIIIFFVLSSGKIVPTGTETGYEQHDAGDNNDADAMNSAEDVVDSTEDEKQTGSGND